MYWSIPISSLGIIGFLLTLSTILIIGTTCLPEKGIDRFYMALTGLTEFASQIAIVFTAKMENAANGNLLTISFDIIVAFLAQFLFFQVQYIYILVNKSALNFPMFLANSWTVQCHWSTVNIFGNINIWIFKNTEEYIPRPLVSF